MYLMRSPDLVYLVVRSPDLVGWVMGTQPNIIPMML
jgi:hypothetical protein